MIAIADSVSGSGTTSSSRPAACRGRVRISFDGGYEVSFLAFVEPGHGGYDVSVVVTVTAVLCQLAQPSYSQRPTQPNQASLVQLYSIAKMSTTIEPDEPIHERPSGPISSSSPDLESGNHPTQGLTGIFRQVSLPTSQQPSSSHPRLQSAHPVALFVLYLLRLAAIATYILCGFFTDNYVVSVRLAHLAAWHIVNSPVCRP